MKGEGEEKKREKLGEREEERKRMKNISMKERNIERKEEGCCNKVRKTWINKWGKFSET